MGVNSLPKTVICQRRDCDLNPGPTAPEFSTLSTQLSSHPVSIEVAKRIINPPRAEYCDELVYLSVSLRAYL